MIILMVSVYPWKKGGGGEMDFDLARELDCYEALELAYWRVRDWSAWSWQMGNWGMADHIPRGEKGIWSHGAKHFTFMIAFIHSGENFDPFSLKGNIHHMTYFACDSKSSGVWRYCSYKKIYSLIFVLLLYHSCQLSKQFVFNVMVFLFYLNRSLDLSSFLGTSCNDFLDGRSAGTVV